MSCIKSQVELALTQPGAVNLNTQVQAQVVFEKAVLGSVTLCLSYNIAGIE